MKLELPDVTAIGLVKDLPEVQTIDAQILQIRNDFSKRREEMQKTLEHFADVAQAQHDALWKQLAGELQKRGLFPKDYTDTKYQLTIDRGVVYLSPRGEADAPCTCLLCRITGGRVQH